MTNFRSLFNNGPLTLNWDLCIVQSQPRFKTCLLGLAYS